MPTAHLQPVHRADSARAARTILAAGALAAVAIGLGAVVLRGATNYLAAGFAFPGWFTSIGTAGLRICADAAGGITVGALVFAAICCPPSSAGRLRADGYAAVSLARRAAPVWAAAALLLGPFSAANVVGQPIGQLATGGHLLSVMGQTLPSRGWLVAGLLAVLMVAGTRAVLSFSGVVGLALLGALALLPPAVVGNAGEGLGHDVSTTAIIVHVLGASVWLGMALAAVSRLRRAPLHPALARRLGRMLVGCAVATAGSGLALAANMVGIGQFLTTQYGRLAVLEAVVMVVAGAGTWWLARRAQRTWPTPARGTQTSRALPGRLVMVLAGQAAVLLAGLGAAVAMAQQPAAAFFVTNPTPSSQELGYTLPDPPGLVTLAVTWRFDLLLGSASIVLAAVYLIGVRRLRRAGVAWPPGRTAAFVAGCACLLLVTSSGLAAYAEATFSMHMVAHMTLNMLAPALLVLGGPVSLLFTCYPADAGGGAPGPRVWVNWLLASWPVRVLTNPFGAITVLAALLFGLYLTPIFSYAVGYHWFHELMNIAFFVSGYFLFWQIVGIDPLPHRAGHLTRLGLLVVMMPLDAVFGVAILTSHDILGFIFYGYLYLPWMGDLVSDQRLGALIAWIGGEIPLIPVAIVLLVQWWRADAAAEPATGSDPVGALWGELQRGRGGHVEGF